MPPAFVAMFPPIWLEPLEAKSIGQINPEASQCLWTVSVIAPEKEISSLLEKPGRYSIPKKN